MGAFEYIDYDGLIDAVCKTIQHKSVAKKDDSGYPYGKDVYECLCFALDHARSLGFSVQEMDHRIGWAEIGEGEEMIAIPGHLDTVPEGKGWTVDPFGGVIQNGRIYGRGATDDKGPVLSALYALKAVADSGVPLKKRVRVMFGCDEETGCTDLEYYVEHGGELPVSGFTPDGDFPLVNGEKGIAIDIFQRPLNNSELVSLEGGDAVNIVPNECTAVLKDGRTFEAKGKSAHGATPQNGINAIGLLLKQLVDALEDGNTRDAIRCLWEKIGMEYDGKALGIAMEDEQSGPLTFNLGTIKGDDKHIEVGLNYRTPVTKDIEKCAAIVERVLGDCGFELKSREIQKPLYYEKDNPMIKALISAYCAVTGTQVEPICIGGGTYAKHLPNVVAFGPVFPGDECTEHQADEYIAIDRLKEMTQIYAAAIVELLR